MRVLIADDEKLARSNVKGILEELNLPLEIVGEAKNGEEALTMLKEHQPDIAFVDIRMPKLNGLEAIKYGKPFSPHTKWIILSGISEFHYAQEAIRLDAVNYLLKPVNPVELEQSLNTLLLQNKKIITTQNEQFENEIIAFLNGLSPLSRESGAQSTDTRYICATFFIDSYIEETLKAKRLKALSDDLRKMIQRELNDDVRLSLFISPRGDLTTLGAWGFGKGTETEGKTIIHNYFKKVTDTIKNRSCEDLAITVIQSAEILSLDNLQQQLDLMAERAALRTVLGVGTKLELNELLLYRQDNSINEMATCLFKLSNYYKDESYLNYMIALDSLEKQMVHFNPSVTTKKNMTAFLNVSLGCSLHVEQDMRSWIKDLNQIGRKLLTNHQKNKTNHPDIINQVTDFIHHNYMFDIGISDIADKINITPNYLSTLFHKRMGINFVKYLTRVRMLKAKELLMDPNIQVQEVSRQLGYFSTRHFTKLFSEFTGCYPSEYRDKFKT